VEEGLERSVTGHTRVSRYMMEADGLRCAARPSSISLYALAHPRRSSIAAGRVTVTTMTACDHEHRRMKLGVNLPAVARPKRVLAWPHDEYGAPREPVVKQPTPVFLYFGIIDILQVREYACPLVQTTRTHACAGGWIPPCCARWPTRVNLALRWFDLQAWVEDGKAEPCNPLTLAGGTTQEYNTHKLMEHYLRSMYYDSHTISAVDPSEYARRCSGFLNEIFEDAKGG
jgi:hypothetical protein